MVYFNMQQLNIKLRIVLYIVWEKWIILLESLKKIFMSSLYTNSYFCQVIPFNRIMKNENSNEVIVNQEIWCISIWGIKHMSKNE